jgi:DUF4097 and DUF4098 domain-containing protein YvlB
MKAMRKTAISILITSGLLCAACVVAVVDPAAQGRSWPQTSFQESLSSNPEGHHPGEPEGDIQISGWKEERVEITAQWPRNRAFLRTILSATVSNPDVRVRATADSVRISTKPGGYDDEDNVVHYVLNVPRSINLDSVRTARGKILISDVYGRAVLDADEGSVNVGNYSGSLDIRLGSGEVEAEVLDLRPQDSVRIKVERGDIVLFLEPDAAAQLMAEAPAGAVSSEIDLGQPLPARKVTARMAEGQATIELTAVQGDIKIRKVEVQR